MLNSVFRGFYLLSFFFLAVCQPFLMYPLDPSGDTSGNLSSRSGKEEFAETFVSDKLDLVFVLDTSPGMENFYQENLFGAEFLNRFQAYNWRFAYTDMSVEDMSVEVKEQQGEEESCGFFSGLIMTVGGALISEPFIAGVGLSKMGKCLLSLPDFFINNEKGFANGSFLPFEYEGRKLNLNYLTVSVENYNEIFNHTVRLGNEGKLIPYDAPEQKDHKAYPLSSMILSLSRERAKNADSQNEPAPSFFRDDSLIVYVLVTIHDLQDPIDTEKFKKNVRSDFGSEDRVKIIPVTLSPDSSVICQIYQQMPSTDTSKLGRLGEEFGSTVIDICSTKLADELFTEIKKSLSPTGFLND